MAGAKRAGPEHVAAERREDIRRRLNVLRVAAGHDGERTVYGALDAAGDRRIDEP